LVVSRPLTEVVHDGHVDRGDKSKDHEERVDEGEIGDDAVAETGHRVLTLLQEKVEEGLVGSALSVQLQFNVFLLELVSVGEAFALLFVDLLPRTTVATGDADARVQERQTDLDLEVVKRVHCPQHLLRVANFFAFHTRRTEIYL